MTNGNWMHCRSFNDSQNSAQDRFDEFKITNGDCATQLNYQITLTCKLPSANICLILFVLICDDGHTLSSFYDNKDSTNPYNFVMFVNLT